MNNKRFKTFLKYFCLAGGGLFLLLLLAEMGTGKSRAANMTSGYTPTNGQSMTVSQFLQAFTSGTVTNISSSDINDGAITLTKMAVSSVNSSKVVDLTLLGGPGGDIASNTITTVNIAPLTFTGYEFSTNVHFPTNGFVAFTNTGTTLSFIKDQISSDAVLGTNASGGSASSNLVTKLNSVGKLDPSLYYSGTITQVVVSTDKAGSSTLSTLASYTPTITNGYVALFAQAQYTNVNTGGGDLSIVIDDGTTTYSSIVRSITASDPKAVPLSCQAFVVLTNASKTFNLKGRASGNAGGWIKNGVDPVNSYGLTNATQLIGIEIPIP